MPKPRKFVSRQQWGARTPKSVQTVSREQVTELFIHHTVTQAPAHHAQCLSLVKGIQNHHMNVNDWSDIGYSFLVCPHGWTFEGRGWDAMTAAQVGHNYQGRAIAAIGNYQANEPSTLLLEGLTSTIKWGKEELPKPTKVLGHRDVNPTTCPGDRLYAWVQEGGWKHKWTLDELRQKILDLRKAGWPWKAIKRTKWWKAFKRRGGS